MVEVSSAAFAETNGGIAFNASGVVPIGPARFAFIDNRDPTSLFELRLNPDGSQRGPIIRRRLVGPSPFALSDPEGLARVEVSGRVYLVAASSLAVKGISATGTVLAHDGLVRIHYADHGDLHVDVMSGFRRWLVAAHPTMAAAADLAPDAGGLNIEGLAWDPTRHALLFGVRSPVAGGRVPILCVHVDFEAPWTTAALQVLPSLAITRSEFAVAQGIRDLDYDAASKEFLVVVGRSITAGSVPFQLCTWDGSGTHVEVLDVTFRPASMKPEGVTRFPGGGPRKLLFVDDSGGFAILAE